MGKASTTSAGMDYQGVNDSNLARKEMTKAKRINIIAKLTYQIKL